MKHEYLVCYKEKFLLFCDVHLRASETAKQANSQGLNIGVKALKHREKKQQKAKELPKLEELKPEEKHNDLGRKTVAEEPKKDEKVKKGVTAVRLSHR